MSVHYNKQSLLENHQQQAAQERAKRVVAGGGRSPGAVPGDHRGGTVIII